MAYSPPIAIGDYRHMSTKPYPSRVADQFLVRMPDGMRDRLAAEADRSGRSMNAEIVHRLQASLDKQADTPGARIADPEARQQFVQQLRTRQAVVLGRREALRSQRFSVESQIGMAESSLMSLAYALRGTSPEDFDAIDHIHKQRDQFRHNLTQLKRERIRVGEEIEVCDAEMLSIDRTLEQVTGDRQQLIPAYLARENADDAEAEERIERRLSTSSLQARASDTTPEPEHTAPAKKARAVPKKVSQR